MKTNIIKIGVCFLAAISLLACKKENELAFSPSSDDLNIKVGETQQIKVNSYGVKDTTAYAVKNVEWSIEDSFVGSIDENGMVTGRKVGETKVCGKFDNGKVVYADVTVYSENDQCLEPTLESSSSSVFSYEEGLRDSVRVKTDKYAVFKNSSPLYSDTYVIYYFGDYNLRILTFDSKEDLDVVKTQYMPDRYMEDGESAFKDSKSNQIKIDYDYGFGAYYNFGTREYEQFFTDVYAPDAKADVDRVANKDNYTQTALGLTLPFEINPNQGVIDINKLKVAQQLNTADFSKAEAAVDEAIDNIRETYLDSARTWALQEWCWKLHKTPMVGGLRKGHVESEYSEVSWDRVLELDEIVIAAFGETSDFKTLDQLAQTYGTLYMDVATLANITTNEKTIDTQFKTISAKNKSKYNDYCWAAMEALNKAAKKYLTTIYSYTAMNNFVKTCKSDVFGTSTSYYYDIPTIEDTENYQDELETAFDEYEAKKESYSAANWKRMQNMHDEATLEILGSRSKTYSRATLDEAKQYFYNMPTKE